MTFRTSSLRIRRRFLLSLEFSVNGVHCMSWLVTERFLPQPLLASNSHTKHVYTRTACKLRSLSGTCCIAVFRSTTLTIVIHYLQLLATRYTSGSCSCHKHTTNLSTGVSRLLVLDCGMTFHPGFGGRDSPSILSDDF